MFGTGDRLRDEIVVSDEADKSLVPPLLLLPLVENAVTHGIAHVLSGGTVTVTAGRNRRPAARRRRESVRS